MNQSKSDVMPRESVTQKLSPGRPKAKEKNELRFTRVLRGQPKGLQEKRERGRNQREGEERGGRGCHTERVLEETRLDGGGSPRCSVVTELGPGYVWC